MKGRGFCSLSDWITSGLVNVAIEGRIDLWGGEKIEPSGIQLVPFQLSEWFVDVFVFRHGLVNGAFGIKVIANLCGLVVGQGLVEQVESFKVDGGASTTQWILCNVKILRG